MPTRNISAPLSRLRRKDVVCERTADDDGLLPDDDDDDDDGLLDQQRVVGAGERCRWDDDDEGDVRARTPRLPQRRLSAMDRDANMVMQLMLTLCRERQLQFLKIFAIVT